MSKPKRPVFRARRHRMRRYAYDRRMYNHADRYARPIILGSLDVSINAEQIEKLVDMGYLHSTIVGFNADYRTYSQRVNIIQLGKRYCEKGRADLEQAMAQLKSDADATVNLIWGTDIAPNMKPGTSKQGIPTLDHLVRAQYVLHQSAVGLATTQWIEAFEKWISQKFQYDKEWKADQDKELRQKYLGPVLDPVKKAINGMLKQIEDYKKVIGKYIPNDAAINKDITETLNFIKQFTLEDSKLGTFHNKLISLAGYFGTVSESLRTYALVERLDDPHQVIDNVKDGKITFHRVHINGLSDMVVHFSTDVDKAQTTKIPNAGISYKLKTNDNFLMKATFHLSNEADRDLRYLFYLYRNIMALTEFASDKMVARNSNGNRLYVSSRSKRSNILLTLGAAQQAILDFNTYIVYRLMLTSFFGNTVDVKKADPLDLDYFEKLKNAYGTNKYVAPPTFLVTANHVYKTADVIEHYLTLDPKSAEWQATTDWQKNFVGFNAYKKLQNLWEIKKNILADANKSNPAQNVYDVLYQYRDKLNTGTKLPIFRKNRAKLSFYREHTIKL